MAKAESKLREVKGGGDERKTGTWKYRVSLIGVSPMIQNPMTNDVLDDLQFGSAGRRKGANKDIKSEDLAQKRLCLSADGKFGIPANYLFAALVGAGRHVIFDKKTKMSTAETSLIPAFLQINSDLVNDNDDGFLPFVNQDESWVVDRRKGNLKQGAGKGVAVALVRPKFKVWALDVEIEVDHDQVEIGKIMELFIAAGRYMGIGDFRPSCRGPFGRFKVLEFKEIGKVVEEERKAA